MLCGSSRPKAAAKGRFYGFSAPLTGRKIREGIRDIVRKLSFVLILAMSLVVSVNVCLADKGRDPPDPPAVPTIKDVDHSKALPENRLNIPPEEKPDECPPGKIQLQ